MPTNESLVFLTVRGTLLVKAPEAACKLHNETAGSPEGIAAARALGDLSHKVYLPMPGVPGTQDGELLFLDFWTSAEAIAKFFSDPRVHAMASKLFSEREGVVWTAARAAFSFHLPPPMARPDRYLGLIRGVVDSTDTAIEAFRAALAPKLGDARRRGQISHELFVRVPMPGQPAQSEIIGIDHWCDASGMEEHYSGVQTVYEAFVGKPQTSVWQQAYGGVWSEW
jgi:hypothetical protein